MYPSNFRYTKEHEWVDVKDDIGTIGITDYAQHELGDVVFVELPKVGAKLKAGQSLGTVESVKAVSEIYSPVSGEVIQANAASCRRSGNIQQRPAQCGVADQSKARKSMRTNSLDGHARYEAYVSEKEKDTRPDALSPEEPLRAPGNAGCRSACGRSTTFCRPFPKSFG